MNILIVTNIFPPEIGGPATYAYEILTRMSEKGGHTINVVTNTEILNKYENVFGIPQSLG